MAQINFEKLGERLHNARIESGYTLEFVGSKIGVHKSTILRWEKGETEKIKLPIIESLAKIYDVNSLWLMGYDVPMKNEKQDFRYASYNGINIDGLNENDIKEINNFVEFIRNKKKNEKK